MQNNKLKCDDLRFDQYIQNLKKQGVIVHESLRPAIFKMNNGLQYPGLRVQGSVQGQNNLVLVPVNLLLTAHKALQQPELKQIFEQAFYHEGPVWQDRILITFLLYLYWKQDKQNIWCQMVNLFAKEIDILSFWEKEQLSAFKDNSIRKAAQLQRDNFQLQWNKFQQLKQRHQFFTDKCNVFTKDNYKWVYIHTISRCFGSFMNSTYFTPFCQFFNHHCVDVSYNCVAKQQFYKEMQQKKLKSQQIKHKKQQQTKQKQQEQTNNRKQQTKQKHQQFSQTSSVSSGNSIDYIQQGDFNYWQIESYKINWTGKISFDLKDKQTKTVQNMHKQCMICVEQKIVWTGWNYAFIGQIIEKINIVKNQYMAGRKKFIPSKQAYEKIKSTIQSYRLQAMQFHRLMGAKYDPRTQTQQNINNISHLSQERQSNHLMTTSTYNKTTSPPTKQYQYFRIQASSNASFQHNQQIYFCYGRISNRTMLVRYGCCIQQNKYEYVWIKMQLNKVLQPYPDLFDIIQQKGLPIKYKLKLRPHTWCYQLYLWFKALKFDLSRHSVSDIFHPLSLEKQIQVLQQTLQVLKQNMAFYNTYPNYDNLTDSSISYHQYFTRVYHWEKVKIIEKNIQMVQLIVQRFKECLDNKVKIEITQCNSGKSLGNDPENKFSAQLNGYFKLIQNVRLQS